MDVNCLGVFVLVFGLVGVLLFVVFVIVCIVFV